MEREQQKNILLPQERILSRIILIRGIKVMLDRDLAELYEVPAKALKRAVKRNIDRFPPDFMFELSETEEKNLRYQFGTLEIGKYSKYPSYVFTEQGVAMLSTVLRSKKAIQVNIQIIRTFTKIRQMLATNKELRLKVEDMERRYNKNFSSIFETLHPVTKIFIPNPFEKNIINYA